MVAHGALGHFGGADWTTKCFGWIVAQLALPVNIHVRVPYCGTLSWRELRPPEAPHETRLIIV